MGKTKEGYFHDPTDDTLHRQIGEVTAMARQATQRYDGPKPYHEEGTEVAATREFAGDDGLVRRITVVIRNGEVIREGVVIVDG